MKYRSKTFLFGSFWLLIGCFAGVSQSTDVNDPAAKNLLTEVTNTVKAFKNIQIEFKYVFENESENIRQETTGKVSLQENRYVLEILGIKRIFDGETLYTINPEDNEVTISKNNDNEDAVIAPNQMLTFYENGYSYELDIIQTKVGRKIQYIKLTPIDSDSEIKYALLGIDLNKKQIYNLIEIGENGVKTTLTVLNYKTNNDLPPNFFKFESQKYKGYYINDID